MIDDRWLADQLRARGLVTQEQLEAAYLEKPGDLLQSLLASGVIAEADLLRFLGLQFQTRYVSTEKLSTAKIPQWVLALLPVELCEEHLVLPVRCEQETSELSIVCTDPTDATMRESVRQAARVREVRAYVALRHSISAGIRRFYRGDIHAFARADQSLRQNYSEMLSIYEQRLIDFDQDRSTGAALTTSELPEIPTDDDLPLQVEYGPPAATPPVATVDGPPAAPRPQMAPVSTLAARTPESQPGSAAAAPPRATQSSSSVLQPEALLQVVAVLVSTLESDQGWRRGHSAEVSRLALQVAAKAGMDREQLQTIRLASLLHELGKPPEPHLTLLGLAGSEETLAVARSSYSVPARLLEAAHLPQQLEQILTSLYERFDGNGVPGLFVGKSIPLGARVIAAVDAYCDTVSNPSSPGGRSELLEEAAQRLQSATAGNVLDPEIVALLLKTISSEEARDRRTGPRPLVLVIDAEMGSTAVLEQKLVAAGCEARVVRTTAEAALVVLSERVDLILSEVRLEPVDGFIFLERLRADKRTCDLPVIFVSDRTAPEDLNRGFELGALDYIFKPYTPEVLVAKVRRVLDQRPAAGR